MARLAIAASAIIFLSCDESLPPRVDPFSIPPTDFLSVSFSVEPGLVLFTERSDTIPTSGGTFNIQVTNLSDEVLQGPHDIRVEIDYLLYGLPTNARQAIGDSNRLVNVYNFNGDHFMLEDGLLTIDPESTATFIIQMNHVRDEWWNMANPTVIPPNYFLGINTDVLDFTATGELTLFKGFPPIELSEISYEISYRFLFGGTVFIVDEQISQSDGIVEISWGVDEDLLGNPEWFKGFIVQRSGEDVHESYRTISVGYVTPPYFDQPGPGIWYYRIAQVEDQTRHYSLVAITGYSRSLRITVP